MLTNTLGQQDRDRIQSLQLPAPFGEAAFASEFGDVRGLVCTKLDARESQAYGLVSEALTRGAPVRPSNAPAAPAVAPSRFRPKDLIAELDIINAQIHKMMFQVENAVARLAASG